MTNNTAHDTGTFGQESETRQKMEAELKHNYRFQPDQKIAGRYVVIAPLGFGGFAEVYHCLDKNLGREVAVKVLTQERADLPDEARTAAQLDHPHIVSVYESTTLPSDNTPIVIYKYIAGQTLEDLLNQTNYRRLTLNETASAIIEQIGAALDYAHRQDVIHRDVKPSNIIIDETGQAYLTDFGLASVKKGPEGTSMLSADVRQTLSGTVPYMTPEQLLGKSDGNHQTSDIYSLGVVVYEMLTGRLPYQGRDTRLILNIANENVTPIPPSVANAELPPSVDNVLLRALNHDPEQRYPSAKEFIADLKTVTADFSQANTQYQKAMDYVEQQQWRAANNILELLPTNFKDVKLRREQVEQKVRLLDLYEKAEQQIETEQYTAALDTLETLQQVDPEYDIQLLRKKALNGQAENEERSLQQQYAEAVRQFNVGEYQAALDTLDVIAKKQAGYPDPENIRKQAQQHVNYQHELRQLYNQGVEHSRNEDWEAALATFETLAEKEPGYEDVAVRLATAQHFSELAGLRRQADDKQTEGEFAAAIDLLNEIKRKNANYKTAEIGSQLQALADALYKQCKTLLEANAFSDCLIYLSQLKEREPDYPELEELELAARDGLARQKKLAALQTLYQEAESKLEARDFVRTLQIWQQIEAEKKDLRFADQRKIVRGAKEGLYGEATAAVAEEQPKRALEFWQLLQTFDADFEDRNEIVIKAQTQLARARRRRQGIFGGIGVVLLLALIFISSQALFGREQAESPTPTIDAGATQTAAALAAFPTSTTTSSPTPAASATATPTAAPTETATATSTPTATATPTATPTPVNVATARLSASIFVNPDENATALTFVNPGESVTLLEQRGSWLRVRNEDDVEGWVAANRFDVSIGTPTETPTPTTTPIPSNTPGVRTATTTLSASIYAGAGTNYAEITYVDSSVIVTVLARSANNSWLFIRTADETEGWVAVSRVRYDGVIADLPVSNEIIEGGTSGGGTGGGSGGGGTEQGLTFDFWHLPGQFSCTANGWTQALFMEGHGGNGSYTYYINGQRVAGPTTTSHIYQLSGSGQTVQVPGRVTSGDGQSREMILFVPAPDCS